MAQIQIEVQPACNAIGQEMAIASKHMKEEQGAAPAAMHVAPYDKRAIACEYMGPRAKEEDAQVHA